MVSAPKVSQPSPYSGGPQCWPSNRAGLGCQALLATGPTDVSISLVGRDWLRCSAVPRVWGKGYRLLPRICCPSFFSQMGSRRDGCLVRLTVELGLAPQASHSESMFLHCTAQVEEGKHQNHWVTSSPLPKAPEGRAFADSSTSKHHTHLMQEKTGPWLGCALCTGDGGWG